VLAQSFLAIAFAGAARLDSEPMVAERYLPDARLKGQPPASDSCASNERAVEPVRALLRLRRTSLRAARLIRLARWRDRRREHPRGFAKEVGDTGPVRGEHTARDGSDRVERPKAVTGWREGCENTVRYSALITLIT
jgi:hypothetical protein